MIENRWEAEVEIAHPRQCCAGALAVRSRRSEQHTIRHVGGQLPEVGGMGLLNVDNVERYAILIRLVQPIELGNLPARTAVKYSCRKSEQPCGRACHSSVSLTVRLRSITGSAKSGGGISHRKWSRPGRHPEGLEWQDHHRCHRDFRHEGAKALRWLPHRHVETGGCRDIQESQSTRDHSNHFQAYFKPPPIRSCRSRG